MINQIKNYNYSNFFTIISNEKKKKIKLKIILSKGNDKKKRTKKKSCELEFSEIPKWAEQTEI